MVTLIVFHNHTGESWADGSGHTLVQRSQEASQDSESGGQGGGSTSQHDKTQEQCGVEHVRANLRYWANIGKAQNM